MDVVVTVPKGMWASWIAEGDLPGDEAQFDSHFFVSSLPNIAPGERVYVVAHGRLRGYAPLVEVEQSCTLSEPTRWHRICLLRRGGAEAITIPQAVRGFQGWRYRWWDREDEVPFPDWRTEGVT